MSGGPVSFCAYDSPDAYCSAPYLMPLLRRALGEPAGRRLLDVGCGNGANTGVYQQWGFRVVGLDPAADGIAVARRTYPGGRFEVGEAAENLLATLGEEPFDVVVSTEVVEHLYDPAAWARGCFRALKPGGLLAVSTPYHGYLKNLAIVLSGSFDSHVHPNLLGGHIKFWSRRTLEELLRGAGFADLRFSGAGRLPLLWKSMVMTARRPG